MSTSSNPIRSYRQAVEKTLADLAQTLGVNKSTLMRWELGRVPAERVIDCEKVTGIPRHKLRPDLYAPPARGGPSTVPGHSVGDAL